MIGRQEEIKQLNRLYDSNKAEFVAIYGRRRIGKTYLVNEVFKDRITFKHSGISPIDNNDSTSPLDRQLNEFYHSLIASGLNPEYKPKNWSDAFFLLQMCLEKIDDGNRKLIFIDELPWLDTPKSGFISALEYFWNNYACSKHNIMLVVCGSANSWILDKLVNNHGGLYGRLTYVIKLMPFTLKECEEFFKYNNIELSKYDITQSYMIFGGVPYYLGYFQSDKSLAQNVDSILFKNNANLKNEYNLLFSSIFTNAEEMKDIIKILSSNSIGYSRSEIIDKLKVKGGGVLTKNLEALIASDFIIKYRPFKRKKDYYKLIDPFCIFYTHFLNNKKLDEDFYSSNIDSPKLNSWRGIAFENVCFNHIKQIKKALDIFGISTEISSWINKDEEKGSQIDLLIIRKDNVVNMCEIKFYSSTYIVSKDYFLTLNERKNALINELSPKQTIRHTLISTYGLKSNQYSDIFTNTITLEDLFKY